MNLKIVFKLEGKMKNSYNTEQKKLILECLKENSDSYISVEDILNYLNKKGLQVGTTTIYRYLNFLEKEGAVRIENIKTTRYFQYIVENCKNHYHIKCEKCGKIEHLECEEIISLCTHIKKEHDFVISQKNVIYGICGLCSNN